ncbi:phytoene/squalene synthase family protein [Arthrobacter sp. JZ12]|uniref:phytoene/squalene synthase family protein n=1 Tax=Arthrobacter sp. JZ12 TaxID=2654190 RepID=UPI002B47C6C2|nr:phytoene/squalene synthase family protein [Arthrobacter sp. JZ12]WRH23958.1 phytoene/squalene synthase family protein [Arthrobacter sp. JZ12]
MNRDRDALADYTDAAMKSSAVVLHAYSTSFGLASRLFEASVRRQVESVYALVRVADEIVDGVSSAAGLDAEETRRQLDEFERETERALAIGYSANLVVHAFADTARRTGIGTELTQPFFASMRADLDRVEHTPESFEEYVYGSAEVVGLMCLKCFLHGRDVTPDERARLERGARHLGAAFQKVNFLRDLAEDFESLGRSYFPDVSPANFDEEHKLLLLKDIDHDLDESRRVLRGLPPSSRRAVALAQELFAELADRIRDTPAAELMTTRISVPNTVKMRIALAVLAGKRGMSAAEDRETGAEAR